MAADPDRDVVYVVDLASLAVRTVALMSGDEPGRLAEDGAGLIHVALRRAGAVVTIDPVAASVKDRQKVCPAPRGVAWDSSADLVWVACATGELVGLPSAGGSATRLYIVERDLRDVLVDQGSVAVTQFRSAKVLRLASDGTVARRDALPAVQPSSGAQVVWRAVSGPGGSLVAVHQTDSLENVTTQVQGGYGGCGGFGRLSGFRGARVDAALPVPPSPPAFLHARPLPIAVAAGA